MSRFTDPEIDPGSIMDYGFSVDATAEPTHPVIDPDQGPHDTLPRDLVVAERLFPGATVEQVVENGLTFRVLHLSGVDDPRRDAAYR